MAVAQLTAVNDRAIPLVAVLFAVFGIAYLLPKAITALRLAAIPTVGQELGDKEKRRQAYLAGARKLYNDGYKRVNMLPPECAILWAINNYLMVIKQFKNGVFRITTSRC
jgi:hypothetical protein